MNMEGPAMSDPRVLVAMGEGLNLGDPPTVILGLTDATWADIDNGKAQDIDLRPLGIAAVVLVMRGKDHNDIKKQLLVAARELHVPAGDLADLSVPKPRRQ